MDLFENLAKKRRGIKDDSSTTTGKPKDPGMSLFERMAAHRRNLQLIDESTRATVAESIRDKLLNNDQPKIDKPAADKKSNIIIEKVDGKFNIKLEGQSDILLIYNTEEEAVNEGKATAERLDANFVGMKESKINEQKKCPKCGHEMTMGAPHSEGITVQWECHNCGKIIQESNIPDPGEPSKDEIFDKIEDYLRSLPAGGLKEIYDKFELDVPTFQSDHVRHSVRNLLNAAWNDDDLTDYLYGLATGQKIKESNIPDPDEYRKLTFEVGETVRIPVGGPQAVTKGGEQWTDAEILEISPDNKSLKVRIKETGEERWINRFARPVKKLKKTSEAKINEVKAFASGEERDKYKDKLVKYYREKKIGADDSDRMEMAELAAKALEGLITAMEDADEDYDTLVSALASGDNEEIINRVHPAINENASKINEDGVIGDHKGDEGEDSSEMADDKQKSYEEEAIKQPPGTKDVSIEKEYVGQSEDNHYYMITTDDGDLQLVDQEGKKVYSAKEKSLDVKDLRGFIAAVIKDVEIDSVTRSIVMDYIIPEEKPPEPEPAEAEKDEGEEEEEEKPEAEPPPHPVEREKETRESKINEDTKIGNLRGEVDEYGYRIIDIESGEEVYSAGNNRFDSQQFAKPGTKDAVSIEELKDFAKQTGEEIAKENGVRYLGTEIKESIKESINERYHRYRVKFINKFGNEDEVDVNTHTKEEAYSVCQELWDAIECIDVKQLPTAKKKKPYRPPPPFFESKINEDINDRIRIAQLNCDWKENFSGKEISKTIKQVGGSQEVYDYDQDEVDSKVMFVSSIKLTPEQLDKLWQAGDLSTGDKDYWEGPTFEDIIKQLTKHMKKSTEEKPYRPSPPFFESKKLLIEMKVSDGTNEFDVYLSDDGTMDTVININGREFRFDSEFAAMWRDSEGALSEEGLRELALDALSNMEQEEYDELLKKEEKHEIIDLGDHQREAMRRMRGSESKIYEHMKDIPDSLKDAESKGFKGSVDANLETSLYEYGLIHKDLGDGKYLFIFGVDHGSPDKGSDEWTTFAEVHYDESDFTDTINASWFKLDDVLKFVSAKSKEDWMKLSLPSRVYDLVSYYGYENIFGSAVGSEIPRNVKESKVNECVKIEDSGYELVNKYEGYVILAEKDNPDDKSEWKEITEEEEAKNEDFVIDIDNKLYGYSGRVKESRINENSELKEMKIDETKKEDVIFISADHRRTHEFVEEAMEEIPKLGLHAYKDPEMEGSDFYSVIISKKPLNKKELVEISRKHWDVEDDDELQEALEAAIDSGENLDEKEMISKKTGRKLKASAAVRHRGKVVFPAERSKDKKDHFPINNIGQARNALARSHQYKSAPPWYSGSLSSLQNAVRRAVKAAYPSIKVSESVNVIEEIKQPRDLIDPSRGENLLRKLLKR